VLVVGYLGGQPTAAELYDPRTRTWRDAPGLSPPRFYHAAIRLCTGDILVAGGNASGSPTNSAVVYDPDTGIWYPVAPLPWIGSGASAVLLGDCTGLVVTEHQTARYDPSIDRWWNLRPIRTHQWATLTALADGSALWVAGNGFVGPGPLDSGPIPHVDRFDFASGRWQVAADVEPRIQHTSTLLPDGSLLVVGGRSDQPAVQMFCPTTCP
jgi:hypothetical protein